MAKAKLFPVVILQNEIFDHRREEKYGSEAFKYINISELQNRVLTIGRPIIHHGRRPKVVHARTHNSLSFVVSWEENGEISFEPYYSYRKSYGKLHFAEVLGGTAKFMTANDAIAYFFGGDGIAERSSTWDVTGQLMTPFSKTLCGYPVLTASEAAGNRFPQIQEIADGCQADDQIQPFFLVGGQDMTAHELIEATSRTPHWIDLYSRLNLWDHRFDIQNPEIIGG